MQNGKPGFDAVERARSCYFSARTRQMSILSKLLARLLRSRGKLPRVSNAIPRWPVSRCSLPRLCWRRALRMSGA
jgi:hypothetical protein